MSIALWFLRGLATLFGPMMIRFLVSLGIGVATFTGVKALIDLTKQQVIQQLGVMPANVINLLALLKIDVAINILFSALIIRLTLMGMNAAGNMTRFKIGS